MTVSMPKCKITVLKKMVNQDIADQYLETSGSWGACDQFRDGQEIIVEHPYQPPEGFCTWAWADIRHDITAIMAGADFPWIKQRGVIITGCTDWFRPVIFKIERLG
jgi:uncharacterized repeat protein (TIGR04076 family)